MHSTDRRAAWRNTRRDVFVGSRVSILRNCVADFELNRLRSRMPESADVRARAAAAVVVVAVLAVGWTQLFRPGYSVDEEFTVFAVRGIEASARSLPLLPSGLLYDRGLAYSYASSLAAKVSGIELPAYRALSLLSAVVAVWSLGVVVSRASSAMAGTLAVFLAAASLPFWATATTGRFYAPLLAV